MNINKKNAVIIISAIILALIAFAGFMFYDYFNTSSAKNESMEGENSAVGGSPTPGESPNSNEASQVEVKTKGNVKGGLLTCVDKCGNGICEKKDPACDPMGGSLNCVCEENAQICPADCK